jgi:hypothetical protein
MISANSLILGLLYVAITASVLPVFSSLSVWLQLALVAVAGCVPIASKYNKVLLNNFFGSVIAIVALLVYVPQLSKSNIALPLLHILCLLLVVRLLGPRTVRHLLQTFLLASSVLAASSLLTLDALYLGCLITLILVVPGALVLLCFVAEEENRVFSIAELRLLLRPFALLSLFSLVSMVVLFIFLPRTHTPFWDFINPVGKAVVSITDQVSPGDFAELATQGAVAFRAKMDSLPSGTVYWRALVLNEIDDSGKGWRRSSLKTREKSRIAGELSDVSIFSDVKAGRYLVALDRSVELLEIRHQQEADGTYLLKSRQQGRLNYRSVYSPQTEFFLVAGRDNYLQLPAIISLRLSQLSMDLLENAHSYEEKRAALDRFFLTQELTYAAEGLEKTGTPVDHFLFESRRGYCEYFATSYALLLRLLGVPARLVGGYLGGDYNRLGGYYLVSEDDAHVWVEALDDQSRWQRIDPSLLAVNAATAVATRGTDVGFGFQAVSDLFYHFWTRAVLNYDISQQFALLKSAGSGLKKISIKEINLDIKIAWVFTPVLLIALYFRFWFHSRATLVRSYRKRVARCCGLKSLPDSLGFYRIATVTCHPVCVAFAKLYGEAVYGGRSLNRKEKKALKQMLVKLKTVQFSNDIVENLMAEQKNDRKV